MLKLGAGVFGCYDGAQLTVVAAAVDRRRHSCQLKQALDALDGQGAMIPIQVVVGALSHRPTGIPAGAARRSAVDAAKQVRRLLHDAYDFSDNGPDVDAGDQGVRYPLLEALGIELRSNSRRRLPIQKATRLI